MKSSSGELQTVVCAEPFSVMGVLEIEEQAWETRVARKTRKKASNSR